jgi:DNA-binding MarR family transcriptional regulator
MSDSILGRSRKFSSEKGSAILPILTKDPLVAEHEKFSTLRFLWQLVDLGYWAQLGYGEKSVLIVLLRYANESGQAWPTIARVAAESGIHRINVQRAIKRLAAQGLVVKKFIRLSARRSKNLFTLRIPETVLRREIRREKQERNSQGRFTTKKAALTSNAGGLVSKPSLRSNVNGLVSGAVSDECSADGCPLTSNVDGQKSVALTDLKENIEEKEEKEKNGGRLPPSQVRSAPPPEREIGIPKKAQIDSLVRNLAKAFDATKSSDTPSGESAFREMRKKLGLPEDSQDE